MSSRHEIVPGYQLLSNPDLARTGAADWDRRFQHYVIRTSLSNADRAFGAFYRADESYEREILNIRAKFGDRTGSPEEVALDAANFGRMKRAEEAIDRDYFTPMWDAAIALFLTPAPNMAAALFKIELAQLHDLHCSTDEEAMDLIHADIARLQGFERYSAERAAA